MTFQNNIDTLHHVAPSWGLKMNSSKHQQPNDWERIGLFREKKSVADLDVTVDTALKFQHHITDITQKN